MTENPWQRLSRLAYARMDHLGITQGDLESRHNGPSSAWLRKLKTHQGPPSSRHSRALRSLSLALGWSEDTARSILVDDRAGWTVKNLASEEHDLIYGEASSSQTAGDPTSLVRRLTDLFRTDAMAGVTDAEMADLLEAIESKLPQPKARDRRQQRKSG